MSAGTLLLIHCDDDLARIDALAEAACSDWPGAGSPPLHRLTGPQTLSSPSLPADAVAAWMFCPAHSAVALSDQVLDELEQWQLPTLLTRFGETLPPGTIMRDGVVIGPPDAAPHELRLMLQTLLSQGHLIAQLKHERNITRRHHHGMRGELNRLDEELRLASRIQRELMPDGPMRFSDVSFDVLFRPAGYVSGDLYDVQRLDEHHVGFYVADAVGHGVPAAMMTVLIKHGMPMKQISGSDYHILPPHEALRQLNMQMSLQPEGGHVRFATACYGVLNVQTRRLQLARAGHPPPILIHADGRSEYLDADGPLLGVFVDEEFEPAECTMAPGDRLLLYSDGFEMVFKDTVEGGEPAYVPVLRQLGDGPGDRAIVRLSELLDRQPGSLHQVDDLTVLLVGVGCEAESSDAKQDENHLVADRV